jgi:uridine phosphorylase
MLTLGRLMGVRTAVLTMATVLRNLKQVLEGQARTDAEDLLCRVALEGIYRFATTQKEVLL